MTRRTTRDRLLAAAGEILRRDGYSRLTMERVAAESGVAKTTLYRRWPTKAALCMELYLDISGRELGASAVTPGNLSMERITSLYDMPSVSRSIVSALKTSKSISRPVAWLWPTGTRA